MPRCEAPAGCTGSESRCEDGRAVICPDQPIDCAAMGMQCVVNGGQPTCLPAGSACAGTRSCDGSIARPCWNGAVVGPGTDCGRLGLECLDGDCVPGVSEEVCEGDFLNSSCDGTRLHCCLPARTETSTVLRARQLDCAELRLRCAAEQGSGSARCALP